MSVLYNNREITIDELVKIVQPFPSGHVIKGLTGFMVFNFISLLKRQRPDMQKVRLFVNQSGDCSVHIR